jgi:hypothetical protein
VEKISDGINPDVPLIVRIKEKLKLGGVILNIIEICMTNKFKRGFTKNLDFIFI